MPNNAVTLTQSNSEFSTALYMTILENSQNKDIVLSPLFLQSCIGLAYAASAGETSVELAKALKLPEDDKPTVEKCFQYLLQKYSNNPGLEFATKIYVGRDVKFKSSFSKTVTKNFFSEVEKIDFSDIEEATKTVNEWVSRKTSQKINNIIDSNVLSSTTNMVLVCATYFKGIWEKCFYPLDTEISNFWISENEKRETEVMYQTGFFKYGIVEELNATALEMKYSNTDLWMLIILPNGREELKSMEEKLQFVDLIDVTLKLSRKHVEVYLPKFTVECQLELQLPLTELGMGLLFSHPDFGNMIENGENLKVDKLIHKVFVEVSEQGVDISSRLGISELVQPDSFTGLETFNAEHPFFFAIKSDSAILFTGRYVHS